jgi:glycine cleavage system H protein
MPEVPEGLYYTSEHEWLRVDNGECTVGITDYAQGELGDIVYVELPEVGQAVQAGQSFGTVEAVKTVADLYSPVSGEVAAVNEVLAEDATPINGDPYGEGWIIRVRLQDRAELDGLLDAAAYARMTEE